MDAIEMAFFYGDFSELHGVIRDMLSEDFDDTNTHD